MLKTLFSQAALGWAGRRVLDWGGWIGTILVAAVQLYNALPPSQQGVINSALTGHWQDITLGALIPFAMLIWSQVMSFKATVKPQIVTEDGTKIATRELPSGKRTYVDEAAKVAAEKRKAEKAKTPGLLERLFGR